MIQKRGCSLFYFVSHT